MSKGIRRRRGREKGRGGRTGRREREGGRMLRVAVAPEYAVAYIGCFPVSVKPSSCPESERAAIAKLSCWLNANPAETEKWILAARNPLPRKMRSSDPQMWCVLPWHPAFGFRDFAKSALKELVPFMHLASNAFETPVCIRVSWRNAAPNDSIRFDAQ